MTLSEYLSWWRRRADHDVAAEKVDGSCQKLHSGSEVAAATGSSSNPGARCGQAAHGTASGGSAEAEPLLYLKDWHFASEHLLYQVPEPHR